MDFWIHLLKILDTSLAETPRSYGLFHLISIALSIVLAVMLCAFHRKDKPDRVRKVVFAISVFVLVLEILKQINYSASFPEGGGVTWDFQWYAFPFQFCSTPMYVGILQGFFKKGKIHDALCAFLATYAIFAGLCVMIYPNDVFISTLFICIQTMVCHGTMIPIGVYLMYTGHVKTEHKTILKAMCVFGAAMVIAFLLNEIVYASGVLVPDDETFNMFFISRHFPSTLPVYSAVHNVVPFPINMLIYFAGFSAAAFIMLLASMGIKKLYGTITKKKIKGIDQ